MVNADEQANGGETTSGLRRPLSWTVDAGLPVVCAVLAGSAALGVIVGKFENPWWVASLGLKMLRSGGDYDDVAADVVWSFLGGPVRAVVVALLLLPAFDFLHQLIGLRLNGRTLGKSLFGIQVCPATARRPAGTGETVRRTSAIDLRRAAVRTTITTLTRTGLPVLSLIALLNSQRLSTAILAVGWVVALGTHLVAALHGRRTPADLVAGTMVVRSQQLHRVAARKAVATSQAAARGVTSTIANSESLRRISSSDAVQPVQNGGRAAVNRGREAARAANNARKAIAANDRFQQALASDQAKAVQNVGGTALHRGRNAVQAARQAARQAGRAQPARRREHPCQELGAAPGEPPAHPRPPASYPPPAYPPPSTPPQAPQAPQPSQPSDDNGS